MTEKTKAVVRHPVRMVQVCGWRVLIPLRFRSAESLRADLKQIKIEEAASEDKIRSLEREKAECPVCKCEAQR